jgi:uncharacterized membrane protein YdbT with pleckstrin-like domain
LISIRQKQQAEQNKRKRKKRSEDDEEEEEEEEEEEMTVQLNTFTAALLKGQTQERWQSNLVRQGITDVLATVPDRTLTTRQLRERLVSNNDSNNSSSLNHLLLTYYYYYYLIIAGTCK